MAPQSLTRAATPALLVATGILAAGCASGRTPDVADEAPQPPAAEAPPAAAAPPQPAAEGAQPPVEAEPAAPGGGIFTDAQARRGGRPLTRSAPNATPRASFGAGPSSAPGGAGPSTPSSAPCAPRCPTTTPADWRNRSTWTWCRTSLASTGTTADPPSSRPIRRCGRSALPRRSLAAERPAAEPERCRARPEFGPAANRGGADRSARLRQGGGRRSRGGAVRRKRRGRRGAWARPWRPARRRRGPLGAHAADSRRRGRRRRRLRGVDSAQPATVRRPGLADRPVRPGKLARHVGRRDHAASAPATAAGPTSCSGPGGRAERSKCGARGTNGGRRCCCPACSSPPRT